MTEKTIETLYRVQFKTDAQHYDLFVRHVYPSDMHGFICIEGFLFLEESRHIIDPRVEKLMLEFAEVDTAFIPYHQIVRIDKVQKSGESRVVESTSAGHKVLPFPVRS